MEERWFFTNHSCKPVKRTNDFEGWRSMAESATILIPDISGYTEFLTKTELRTQLPHHQRAAGGDPLREQRRIRARRGRRRCPPALPQGQADRRRRPRPTVPGQIRRGGRAPCEHVRALARRKLEDLDRRLVELAEVRAGLRQVLRRSKSSRGLAAAVCPHIEEPRANRRRRNAR